MIPVQFPPGVTWLEPKNSKIVNWRESHLMRWESGVTMKPIKGWAKQSVGPFASPLRKMHRWLDNGGARCTAYLCEQHCYVERLGTFYDITPAGGLAVPNTVAAGYGEKKYNAGKYGTPRPGISTLSLYGPTYSLGNWGEELRAMTSDDGRYLQWLPTTPSTALVAVTGAPTNNRSFIITPERHAMLFGLGGAANKFGWSDEEDDTDWDFPSLTSKANFYDLFPVAPIVAQQGFEGGTLMFTKEMAYLSEWIGLPYVYNYRPLGRISVPMSPDSICPTPKGVIWVAVDGWWIFDGSSPRVIPCDVWDFIEKYNSVPYSRFSAACVHLEAHGEVWWFFAGKASDGSNMSPAGSNTFYVLYDYRNDIWSTGKLNRVCGFNPANDRYPLMSDGESVWQHETGFFYPDAEMPWIESMNLNGSGGERFFTLKRLLPDVSGDASAIRWRVNKTNARNPYDAGTLTPQRTQNGNGYVDIRETARDMRLRIEMVNNSDWGAVGPILMDAVSRGKQ